MPLLLNVFLVFVFFAAFDARAIVTKAEHMILIDDASGKILAEKNIHGKMPTSSMSKMITVYALFKELKDGSVKLDDEFTVSEKAWKKGGSKMFVEVGSKVKVEDLIRGIIIQSGNDACIVVAENLSGTEEAFAKYLNSIAKSLGMKNSNFVNATGWPDENHYSTPYDLYLLASALVRDFPEYYHYYSEKDFTYNNITQQNRNTLLSRYPAVDGLKTGHTEIAGYGITATAKEGKRRLFVVINGLDSMRERIDEAEKILKYGFMNFENIKLVHEFQTVGYVDVINGRQSRVAIMSDDGVIVSVPKTNKKDIQVELVYQSPIVAPIKKNSKIATLRVNVADEVSKYPLYAAQEVEEANFFDNIFNNFKYYFLW